ncbi:MAG TPA: VIT domain-containing protein [Verrucomicrobiae bacterium]|nr:VIT domain-containing protein [Verrucomicrobiae bacterium]
MLAPTFARADGFIIIEPGPPERPIPWPRPPHRHFFAPLEVAFHHVTVKIDGQIATTSVEQEFYNPNPQRLEGTYLFPLPKDAHIDKFTMDIDGKQTEAELLPADKARRIYEDIVRKMRDPALLEYAGRDVFKVRVFPIEPHRSKRITLSYTQVLKADSGLINYTYPLNTEKFSAKPLANVSVKVELKTERPLKTIYCPSYSVEIKREGSKRATVGFEANEVTPDTDFSLYFAPEQEDVGVNLLTYKTGDEDGYFLLLASPGVDVNEKILPKDVVFVLDTSGSMAGKKLTQAKKALQFCIENLNDEDRFEIVRFSTEVEPLFDKLAEANRSNRDKANDFVKSLKPIGATAIDDALKKASSLQTERDGRPFVVVFLTDGQPTVGVTNPEEIVAHVKRNSAGTRIFSFGIGTDVNTHLLDRIAEETRAFNQYVLPEEDLELKVSSFFSKIKEPVLTDPELKFTGDIRVTKLYPRPLPDLFRGEQLIVAGRYSGHGNSAVVIEGKVNGQTRQFSEDLKFSGESSENDFIPKLWATRRVGYLLDEIRLHGESAELRDEVTELARKYGIVTPYTAYLIAEDEAQRRVPIAMQSLPQLNKDQAATEFARQNWDSFKNERDGEKALAGARFGYALKSANGGFAGGAPAAAEANRALGISGGVPPISSITRSADSNMRLAQYSNEGQGRFVAGRNAFQNGNLWIDSLIQKQPSAKHVRIQFDSTEYFALATKEPRALPWLALGPNVQFVLNGAVYEIYE